MTIAHPPTRFTPEDLLRLPDSNTAELLDGRIVEKNVSITSSQCEGTVFLQFAMFLRGRTTAQVFPSSLGYRCFPDDPDRIRKPDVTVIRNERLAGLPESDPGLMPIAPDLAVEVMSPNDLASEINQKVHEYLEAGFPLVWVVDPQYRTVTVYPLGGKPHILTADDKISAPAAMPGFSCLVAELFPAPLPATPVTT